METVYIRDVVIKLYNSLSTLRNAIDSTVDSLRSKGHHEAVQRIAQNYLLLDKQEELAKQLTDVMGNKMVTTELTSTDMELITEISNKISGISSVIKEDSRELLEELTTGRKIEKNYH